MTRDQIESFFARRERALVSRDAGQVTACYADDAVVDSPTAGGEVRGRPAIQDVTRAWFAGFPDVAFTRQVLLIDGNQAVWIGDVRGTDTGGFMGLPPTHKPFRLPMVMLCVIEDGLIAREQRVYDFTGMLVQIGVLKAKPL